MSYDLEIDQGGRLLPKEFMCSRMPEVRQLSSQLWLKDRASIPQRPKRRLGYTICKMRLMDANVVSGGNQEFVAMSERLSQLLTGLLAVFLDGKPNVRCVSSYEYEMVEKRLQEGRFDEVEKWLDSLLQR